jgi:integrase/recombinase XerD
MLSVYTRHSARCPKKDDIHWKRCRCTKWINGLLNGQFIRKSAKTRSWEKAEDTKRHWEIADKPQKHEPACTRRSKNRPRDGA